MFLKTQIVPKTNFSRRLQSCPLSSKASEPSLALGQDFRIIVGLHGRASSFLLYTTYKRTLMITTMISFL